MCYLNIKEIDVTSYANLLNNIENSAIANIMVFSGYSGLGYENIDKVSKFMYDQMKSNILNMKNAADCLAVDPVLFVVAGATADGIGVCYDVAEKLIAEGFNVQTVGIVSSAATVEESWGKALPDEQADRLKHLVVVDMPPNDWNVIVDGKSLTVDIGLATTKPSHFIFLGGGAVANNEIKELNERLLHEKHNVQVTIRHGVDDFAPKIAKAEKKFNDVLNKNIQKGLSEYDAKEVALTEVNGTKNFEAGQFTGNVPLKKTELDFSF